MPGVAPSVGVEKRTTTAAALPEDVRDDETDDEAASALANFRWGQSKSSFQIL